MITPTLAKEYKGGKSLKDHLYVLSQPKLDGVRCLVTKQDGNIKAYSRNGKEFYNVMHIIKELEGKIKEGEIIDGELYNHDIDFNDIISIVRKKNLSINDVRKSKKLLKYIIYDTVTNDNYSNRFEKLKKFSGNYVKVIECRCIISSLINKTLDEYIANGYEGQIIRLQSTGYEYGRSSNILKHKKFKDAEFRIIRVLEGVGKRKGMAGSLLLTDGKKEFKCSVAGTDEYKIKLLKSKVKNKLATVKFFEYTPEKVPRFPILVEIRDYE